MQYPSPPPNNQWRIQEFQNRGTRSWRDLGIVLTPSHALCFIVRVGRGWFGEERDGTFYNYIWSQTIVNESNIKCQRGPKTPDLQSASLC